MNKQPIKWKFLPFSHRRQDWHHLLWWLGAILIGLIAFILAKIAVFAFALFLEISKKYPWWPFIATPAGGLFLTWFMRKVGAGTEGSGIQQAIAALSVTQYPQQISWLINLKLAASKFIAIIIGIGCGFVVGLEGPTVQIGASIMYTFRRFLPFDNPIARHQLIIMGGAAGIAAAFNAPMAGIMFAFEEMWKSVESKTASRIAVAIILAGFTAHLCSGEESYFGSVDITLGFNLELIPIAIIVIIIGALAGGLFSWMFVRLDQWLPKSIMQFKKAHPYYFVLCCSMLLALCGLFAPIFGSGAELTNKMLYNEVDVAWYYMPLKFISLLLTSLTGVPGGIFSPSLSMGAGVGNCFTWLVATEWQSQILILGMVAALAGVTRAPLTATFIIIEMTNGHSMIFIALAAALFASNIARIFHVKFYEDLANIVLKNMPDNIKNAKDLH